MNNEIIKSYFKNDFNLCDFDYNTLISKSFTVQEIDVLLIELIKRGSLIVKGKYVKLWSNFVISEFIKEDKFDFKQILICLMCLESESYEYLYSFLSFLFSDENESIITKEEFYTLINALTYLHLDGENIYLYINVLMYSNVIENKKR